VIKWEEYHNKYLKNKRGNIISGIVLALIGGPGLITEGFITQTNSFYGIYNTTFAVFFYALFFGTGLGMLGFGLAQLVNARKHLEET
jgi:MFS superfamily sulfate permease-like transporter